MKTTPQKLQQKPEKVVDSSNGSSVKFFLLGSLVAMVSGTVFQLVAQHGPRLIDIVTHVPNSFDNYLPYKCNPNHTFRIEFIKRDPLLLNVVGFLTPREADHLIDLGRPSMSRSTVVDSEKNEVHPGRTSFNAFLKKGQDDVVKCVEERAARFSSVPVNYLESLQVVWYRDGQQYEPHYDFFPEGAAGTERELKRGGQRQITFFVYLNTVPVENGGATYFPNINVSVPAIKTNAAFWYDIDVDGKDDKRTFHGGAPVKNTEKWGLNIWIRQDVFV